MAEHLASSNISAGGLEPAQNLASSPDPANRALPQPLFSPLTIQQTPKPLPCRIPSGHKKLKLLFRHLLNAARALEPGPLVVGLSGGLDSCVLLHLLCCTVDQRRSPLHPCYVKHGIRSRHPEAGPGALASYCQRLGLSLQSYRIQDGWLQEQARRRGLSLEDLARTERYRRLQHYLALLSRHYQLSSQHLKKHDHTSAQCLSGAIVLAHHNDDQAENFFMSLGRGAGAGALAGMRKWQWQPANIARTGEKFAVQLWRPLLSSGLDSEPGWGRQDLQQWAELQQLPHWEDPGNFSQSSLRNFYRWQVLPQLKRLLPNLVHGLQRSQQQLGLLEDWLEQNREQLRGQLELLSDSPETGVGGPCLEWQGDFRKLAQPLRIELIFLIFDRLQRGEQRRKRLPLRFATELSRQWEQHYRNQQSQRQSNPQKRPDSERPFQLQAHGCTWQFCPDALRAWKS